MSGLLFTYFYRQKLNYKKGQVFPFLIAVLCVFIAMAMVTVNLGQLGIFKTELFNSADAGALAAASTLSAALLSLGMKSDMMCGFAIICLIAITYYAPQKSPAEFKVDPVSKELIEIKGTSYGFVTAIMIYISFIIAQLVSFYEAKGEANMAWTGAKKNALSYAFSNVGVDEPRPSFEKFLNGAYSITDSSTLSSSSLQNYYDEYLKGESENAKEYAQSGFGKFASDADRGYWDDDFGKIEPGEKSDEKITSGFGWNKIVGENSYDSFDSYKNYDNYVEAEVKGESTYDLETFNFIDSEVGWVAALLVVIVFAWAYHEYGGWWWGALIAAIIAAVYGALIYAAFPFGLMMSDKEEQIDDNYVTVKVKRYKANESLGVWEMRYGTVEADASAHAFGETGEETIEPVLFDDVVSGFKSLISGGSNVDYYGFFDTSRHLFETGLKSVY